MLKQACVTLQRPPPLTLTLLNNLFVFSIITTSSPAQCSAAFMAQKKPAAPPPITTNFFFTTARYSKRFRRMTAFDKKIFYKFFHDQKEGKWTTENREELTLFLALLLKNKNYLNHNIKIIK
jgi:hypothetical protein